MPRLGVSTDFASIVAATAMPTARWVFTIVRMASDPATQSYVTRRTQAGLSKKEILRCLKRYIARQHYRLILMLAPTAALATPSSTSA